ncbi:hypothetical protein [Shewanella maritima]|uniref:hypothetical protein n=1 Tax=Shewanella maritima TaxID=2520507 RepID=UPI0013EEBC96|nr:hypothetical protein [Shewanella maritima]
MPPETNPNYSYSYDSTGDGEIDRCYEPNELDSASNCGSLATDGTVMPMAGNTSLQVCVTNDNNGASCGFQMVSNGEWHYYEPDLEINCFGDSDVPDYDPDANQQQPGDEQCVANGTGFMCSADPSVECNAQGVCADGCGYVNNQFVCFRETPCTGEGCEPPELDCTKNPESPTCKAKEEEPDPDPEPCTGENCDDNGGENGGNNGGSGGSFVLDYERLINGMKEAAGMLIDESPMPDGDAMVGDVTDKLNAALDEEAKLHEDGLFDGYLDAFDGSVFDVLKNIFPPVGSCTAIDFSLFAIDICPAADIVRSLMATFFYGLTAFYIFHVFSNRFTRSKN